MDRAFTVLGVDRESRNPVQYLVRMPTVTDASAHAGTRGVDVTEIRSESGRTYYPDERGTLKPRRTGQARRHPDLVVFVVAVLIPIVGVVIGGIRLSRRDQSGVGILLASLCGAVILGIVLMSAS